MKVTREASSGTSSRNELSRSEESSGCQPAPDWKLTGCPGVSVPSLVGGGGSPSRSTSAVSVHMDDDARIKDYPTDTK